MAGAQTHRVPRVAVGGEAGLFGAIGEGLSPLSLFLDLCPPLGLLKIDTITLVK